MSIPARVVESAIGGFETMYFREVEYRGSSRIEGPVIGAALDFHGSRSGEIRLAAGDRLALQMTADFLGIDPAAVTRRQMTDDTVSELLNVACGATF